MASDVSDYQSAPTISIHQLCASTAVGGNADDQAPKQQAPATVEAPNVSSRRMDDFLSR